jgi:hypothetical protein
MQRRSTLFWIALTAAGLYAATGAIELVHDQPTVFADPIDYWLEGIFVAALAASVTVLASLARARWTGAGTTFGWTPAACGHLALLVAALVTAIEGREALDVVFPLGVLAIVAGYLVLAVLDARRRLVPRGAGLVLLAGFVAGAVVDGALGGGGGLVFAASWAALARLISESAGAPSLRRSPAPARSTT